jgi:hypothetical protein
MKDTRKRLTLRGSIDVTVNAGFTVNGSPILEYANVLDLKKAWKVEGYAVWPVDFRGGVDAFKGQAALESFLATDRNIVDTAYVEIVNNAQDNRQFAWGNTLIALDGASKSQTTATQSVEAEHYWVDPDHLIQDELNIYVSATSGSDYEGEIKKINYIVYLREVEITPAESIVQNIKGKSQDLST